MNTIKIEKSQHRVGKGRYIQGFIVAEYDDQCALVWASDSVRKLNDAKEIATDLYPEQDFSVEE